MDLQIKCFIDNCIDNNYYHVLIYNFKHNLIFDGYTDKQGILNYKVPCAGIYHIIVTSNITPYRLCQVAIIKPEKYNKIPFIFHKKYRKENHYITFYLTDQNYENLPIKKGEMILWKNT